MAQHNFSTMPPPRRKQSRLTTTLPARITTLCGCQSAVLLDLSLTGARLRMPHNCELSETLKSGDAAEIAWESYNGFGTVAWLSPTPEGIETGLRFDAIIQPHVLIATRDIQDAFAQKGGFRSIVTEQARQWVVGRC